MMQDFVVAKSRRNKKCDRQVLRKQIAYAVKQEQLSTDQDKHTLLRRDLRCDEVEEYVVAIKTGNCAKFGIVKLSQLNLDVCCVENTFTSSREGEYILSPITLLHAAVLARRSKIVLALLRAGANPSVVSSALTSLHLINTSPVTCSSLLSIPTPYAVWLIEQVILRYKVVVSSAAVCDVCGCNYTPSPSANIAIIAIFWRSCGHMTCYQCSWKHATNHSSSKRTMRPYAEQASEVICDELNDISFTLHSASIPSCKYSYDCPSCGSVYDDASSSFLSSSLSCMPGLLSRKLFTSLPLQPSTDKAAKITFRPAPYKTTVSVNMGTCQSSRLLEAFKAIAGGDRYRWHALMTAGCDVTCSLNEYNLSAVEVSAMFNQYDILEYIMESASISDDSGAALYKCDIFQQRVQAAYAIAYHRHHGRLLRLLKSYDISPLDLPMYPTILTAITSSCIAVTELLVRGSRHAGQGSFIIDGAFSDSFLTLVTSILTSQPLAEQCKSSCSNRYYYCDATGFMCRVMETVLEQAKTQKGYDLSVSRVMPYMRLLEYATPGGALPPHIDLSHKCLHSNISSTHTFILYLSSCDSGGETALLESLSGQTLVSVKPLRGRLFVFPHICPHAGLTVECVPKLLLRGEMY